MKILKKSLAILSLFLFYANNAYATTTGKYVPNEKSGIGKMFLLLVAIGLVALVLFLGYKMDKNEISQKRKERIKKYDGENDIYSETHNLHVNESEGRANKEDTENEIDNNHVENNYTEYNKQNENKYNEESNENSYIEDEIIKESEIEIQEVELIKEVEDINLQDEVLEIEKSEHENIEENAPTVEKKSNDSTMIFDTIPFGKMDSNIEKKEDIFNKKIVEVKGYDYEEEDLELLDLEQTIAEANIKRYTRKKEKIEENQKTTKRYTRKKILPNEEKNKIDNNFIKEEKRKRGRPSTKKEIEEKPKRGRPSTKKETEEKPKRGRPSTKKETEEKPKRGRPSTKKEVEEKPKRGRPSIKKK